MKKIFIILILMFIICGCTNKVKEDDTLQIVCPTGAPSLAFLNEIDNENFETNSVVTNIFSMMDASSNKDIVVIDTVSGLKAINNGAPYKLASSITFGNFYIAATGNDDDKEMTNDDVIVLFGKDTTPDLIFHYIYTNIYDANIEYVDSVSDAGKCLALGKNLVSGNEVDYVLIAEPIMYKVLTNKENPTYHRSYPYVDIQEEFKDKTNFDMFQASIFVRNDTNKELVRKYLENLESNINSMLKDTGFVNNTLKNKDNEKISMMFGIPKDLILSVLENNTIGLGYKNAYENKDNIDLYIELFGMEHTSEENYFK